MYESLRFDRLEAGPSVVGPDATSVCCWEARTKRALEKKCHEAGQNIAGDFVLVVCAEPRSGRESI
jgi:hypothetical protein